MKTLCSAILLACILLTCFTDVSPCEESSEFSPFSFEDNGVRSLHFAHSAITFSKEGGRILGLCDNAVLVNIGTKSTPSISGFSFSFDGRFVTGYSEIQPQSLRELLRQIKSPKNYGITRRSDDIDGIFDDNSPNDVAIEISDGRRAVRLYFNKKMTECYYVGPEGEAGNWWRISPDFSAIVKKIVEMPDRKWKTLK